MEYEQTIDKSDKFQDLSSEKSFLISPQSQKVLRLATFDIQGIYEYIAKKHKTERLESLVKKDAILKSGRYRVKRVIGKGSFGKVVEAFDTVCLNNVAIKIVEMKTGPKMSTEVANLKKLNQADPENKSFVRMLEHFEEEGFLCIVLELLSKSLFHHLREVKTMNLAEISAFAQQLFKSLQILHGSNIVHCDLKPENIMLENECTKSIKIVDLGSSCEVGNTIYKIVQSRFYRSPEVTLRFSYSTPIDIWSAGCILAELYLGKPLFESRNEIFQMSKTVNILGPLPRNMIEKSPEYAKYINLTKLETIYSGSLRNLIYNAKDTENASMLEKFTDLLSRCLIYDAQSRITVWEALDHPFINPQGSRNFEKPYEVPWPSLPYTKGFLKCKPKVITKTFKYDSISQDASPYSKHSTAVSRNSPRVYSSDEDGDRPASYAHSKIIIKSTKSNITPIY